MTGISVSHYFFLNLKVDNKQNTILLESLINTKKKQ